VSAQNGADLGAIPSPGAAAQQPASVLGLSEQAQKELEQLNKPQDPKVGVTGPLSLDEAVKAFREYLSGLPSDLLFQPDEASGYVVFKVVNPVTREVIRQYPSDAVIEMARRLKALAPQGKSGIFLDEKL
jgi:uncharacterized FlaG/YvyC family protein